MKRLLLTLAAAVCVVGCGKQDESATDTKKSDSSPTASSSSSAKTPDTRTPPPTASAPTASAALTAPAAEWKTTASGLKYQVLKQGTGTVSPKATDTVVINYTGSLTNGAVFDSTDRTGKPLTYPVNRFIAGWIEGLQLMKVGDKFKFEIPPNLAYADHPPTPAIPPNSTLIFEVELLEIK